VNILTADIGGTRIKLGCVRILNAQNPAGADGSAASADQSATLSATKIIPAESQRGLAPHLEKIADAWRELDPHREAVALGVSFPSITVGSRITTSFGKYEDAPDLDLADWAKRTLGLPLTLENDSRAAAVGEWRYGAGRGCDDLVMVTLGTGIGTCPIIAGVPLRGRHGQAGILGGHLAIPEGRTRCSCGSIGCGEAASATATLAQRAGSRTELADYEAVFRAAAEGDDTAVQLRDQALRSWGEVAVNLIHGYDPERLILGGGVMGSAATIVPAVQQWVDQHACTPWGRVEVMAAQLGDTAGMLGVAHLAAQRFTTGETP